MEQLNFDSDVLNKVYAAMQDVFSKEPVRPNDQPALLRLPREEESATGEFFIRLRIPPNSDLTYDQVFRHFREWLEPEVAKDCANGFPGWVNFNVFIQTGRFSPELLWKIRNRPEVALVSADRYVNQ